MRKILLLAIAASSLLLIAITPLVASDGHRTFKATLDGYHEVNSISTPAAGRFTARLNGDTLTYRLQLRDFLETPLFAHIHFARPDVNGGVIAFLCGGGGKPACPANGVVEGTITAANVIGPTDRGITAGEFDELIRAMRNGATYVNAHTPTYQPGEIRGNIPLEDKAMVESQGPIVDRTLEHPGYGDRAILLLRKMLREGIAEVANGKRPKGVVSCYFSEARVLQRVMRCINRASTRDQPARRPADPRRTGSRLLRSESQSKS